jgi:hypothetical protein
LQLSQPRRELLRDLGAAGRLDDALADAAFRDHEECRDLGDLQALDEVGTPVGVDAHDLEARVVASALENLSQESVGAA